MIFLFNINVNSVEIFCYKLHLFRFQIFLFHALRTETNVIKRDKNNTIGRNIAKKISLY